MENIIETVYDALKKSTKEVQATVEEMNTLEAKVKSGRYSTETVKKELAPRLDDLKRKTRTLSEQAIESARGLVSNYRAEMDEKNNLDPTEITDDIKLLQAGIPLTERDVEHILRRAENNRTMTVLALRYAEQNGLKIQHRPYTFELEQKAAHDTANALDEILTYYPNWIATDKAFYMLDQFFAVE